MDDVIDNPRVKQLVAALLEGNATPEEVCGTCPDLLPVVRRRWLEVCRVRDELDALFPLPSAGGPSTAPAEPSAALPQIPGYQVESELGRGGMGVVFRARQSSLNREVALKMVLAGAYAGPHERKRFQREAEAVAALRHPNVVQIFDFGDSDGRPYFTMEFVEGGSLASKLAGSPQRSRESAALLATLAHAVAAAHAAGIVHRDLKPGNVLLTADATPKISDFGLARRIDEEAALTRTGAALGTPNYMAPEQIKGNSAAIGPAADIYALGAILYEMLTGRPPFQAETSTETLQQALTCDPVRPSRLNAKVPRDLETICLKCLEKKAGQRYASAQHLADDLHRFLDGKPVLARPVGFAARAVKSARRRPALAALFVTVPLLAVAAGSGLWWQNEKRWWQNEKRSQRADACGAIEKGISSAYDLGREEKWQDAALILVGEQNNLAIADSEELGGRIARAQAALQFAEQLEGIRQRHTVTYPELKLKINQDCAQQYAAAFARAELDVDKEESPIAKIRALELRPQIAAALDDWALAAFNTKDYLLQKRLLRIARLADPDPSARADSSEGQGTSGWQDRFRDPDVWGDRQKLTRLADDAAKVSPPLPAHQLGIVCEILLGEDVKPAVAKLLAAALGRRPKDYRLNWEMGEYLDRCRQYQRALAYFRIVVALRPEDPWPLSRLGVALERAGAGNLGEAIETGRRAVNLEPNNALFRRNLVQSLLQAKRIDEARVECEQVLKADPKNTFALLQLGRSYAYTQQPGDAIRMYRRAAEVDPNNIMAWYYLGVALWKLQRFEEAAAAFAKAVKVNPLYLPAQYNLAMSYFQLGKHEAAAVEFRRVIQLFDRGEAQQIAGEALDATPIYHDAWLLLAKSLCCVGRFGEASRAAQRAFALSTMADSERIDLHRIFARCEQLVAIEPKLEAILAEKPFPLSSRTGPTDVPTRRALAEWLHEDKLRTYASAQLYYKVFASQPSLADDLESRDRYRAACAAGLAGCGIGEDAAELDEAVKARLRKQALAWLQADRDAWAKRLRDAGSQDNPNRGGEQIKAATALAEWRQEKELACLRVQAELAKLPAAESKEWRNLWAGVDALAAIDPLRQARGYASRKEWTEAVKSYAALMKQPPADQGEVWYEFAAVQLLAGDAQGYRETCRRMLTLPPSAARLRPFFLARTCTLASGLFDNPALPMLLWSEDAYREARVFSSLRVQGAVQYRAGHEREAVPLFERSLQAEPKRGAAVLNWLWLALAHDRMGDHDEARRRLNQAAAWLDALGSERPANGDQLLKLDLHNWLEANVLRREAELAIGSSGEKK